MKKTRWVRMMLITAAAIGMVGCGQSRGTGQETAKESEPATQVQTQAQTQTSTPETKAEKKETESETQKLITSVEYTSKDGTVKITLPDNTWKVTQDADEMRVFSSGSDAMINIVHASTESAMKTLSIQTTKEALDAALTKQYSDANAYEIQSFESKKVDNVDVYRYVVKYNATARMWAYSVTYGIVASDQAYVITGTVTEDNATLLKAVEDSVDSFTVLKDEELKNITAASLRETAAGTGETTASTDKTTPDTNTTSSEESSSLAAYGSTVTMYASDIVNVRSGPGTDSEIVGGFSLGDAVSVVGETNGWYQVSANGVTGYIRKDLLSSTQPTAQTNAQTSTDTAAVSNYGSAVTMYANGGINVRSQPSTSSDISGTLANGTAVTVTGESNGWYVVSTGSGTGYIAMGLLSTTAPAGGTSSGTSTGGTSTDTSSSSTDTSSSQSTTGYLSGTIVASDGSTLTVAADDGSTYTIDTGSANISTTNGLQAGERVDVGYSQNADGSISASTVNG